MGAAARAVSFRPPRAASARLLRLCRLLLPCPTTPRSASPGSSTGATRTAAARASTPATSPVSSPSSGHEVTVFSGPALPRARRPVAAREGARASTSTARRTRSGCRGRGRSRRRSTSSEFGIMCAAGLPRAVHVQPAGPPAAPAPPRRLRPRPRQPVPRHRPARDDARDGWPVLATLHHPITVDRDLDLAHATSAYRRFTLRRWYGFLEHADEGRARRSRGSSPCRSRASATSSRRWTCRADRLHIVPVGVDPKIFRPLPDIARVPGPLDDHRRAPTCR